ncbi:prolipoprotein diacylglyceryl transferase [Suttonella sp. R2A3]|uniref:prolipoprotein diacylglyceryl transferase n=1 Tax=Suttonella sp. R2A3 TaxID=2908648 RepID=UPI001F46E79A|nr:prolipoprotein diacylglyceryl transferase [Suttonella sp. R2A3]UJF24999.1 prolipoprotein diacylglyceryl transferase [Suttonella sp. R2A3]
MLYHPDINPYIFELGPIKPTWYGMMYVIAFVLAIVLAKYRAKQQPLWTEETADKLVTNYLAFGVILGGRLGYVLFYGLEYWQQDWLYPLKIWQGGMSFHGGLLGVIFACWLFARKQKMHFFQVTDFLAPLIPAGLFFGRIGNFINGELWGKISDVPWAMVFPTGGPYPRHPSQLYEAALEGLVLFVVLWLYSAKPRALGRVSGGFLFGYGLFRALIEFVREPDAHLSYLAWDWLTMGQILSLPMILFGLYLLWRPVTHEKLS